MNLANQDFASFLSYFPQAELPLTIQQNDYHLYSKSNDALPDPLLNLFILPYLDFELDEFTEFLPCLQFESVKGMHSLVFWTARLMHYSFYLINFNSNGQFQHLEELAGFYTEGDKLINKMAHVDVSGTVYILEGDLDKSYQEVNPVGTKKWMLEYLPDGSFLKSEINLEY